MTPKQNQGNQQAQEQNVASKSAALKVTLGEIVEKFARRRPTAVPNATQKSNRTRPQPQPAEHHRREPQAFFDGYAPVVESYRRPAGDYYRPSYSLSTASSRAREVRGPARAEADSMPSSSISHRRDRASQDHAVVQQPQSSWVSSSANTKSSHVREERSMKTVSPPLSTGSANSLPHVSTKAITGQAQVTGGSALDKELAMLPPALQAKVANPFLDASSSRRKRGREMDEVEGNETTSATISNEPGPSKKRAKITPNKAAATKKAATRKKPAATKTSHDDNPRKPALKRARTDGAGEPKRKRARGDEDEHEGEEDRKPRKQQKTSQSKSFGELDEESDMDDFVVHDTPKVRQRRKASAGAAKKFVKG